VDVALALGERIRANGEQPYFDLPSAAEQVLRMDKYDTIYYNVRAPDGASMAGDPGLPLPPESLKPEDGIIAYDGNYLNQEIRLVALLVPCSGRICTVLVAETTAKRSALASNIALLSLMSSLLVVTLMLAILWFGVKRGLAPLEGLSSEIRARSARDLRPIDPGHAPDEARPLVAALNQLFVQVAEASDSQQRFLADAAHQLRTPLAGLQAHTELALAQENVPADVRAQLEQVHRATIRTARLASQLLALARVEPGASRTDVFERVNLRAVVEDAADEWVHRALAKEIDLGFELGEAQPHGDALLLREALRNLVHNALEYTPAGGRVTVRTGTRERNAFLEVEDDGPGIPANERDKVLQRFYRINGTPGTGSGLGLAIVREIAQAHGAKLEIGAGESGRGCKVGLTFPHG
jgi:two-component system sensor histidine kinase TctE